MWPHPRNTGSHWQVEAASKESPSDLLEKPRHHSDFKLGPSELGENTFELGSATTFLIICCSSGRAEQNFLEEEVAGEIHLQAPFKTIQKYTARCL